MIAYLFPGQGAQRAGFLHALDHPEAVAAISEASDILKQDILALDNEETLRSTVAVQITLVVAGVATARALSKEGIEADAVAGLSVGAYGAAVASGAIAFADALNLVQLRAQLMEAAYPSGYGMLAIVGLSEQQVGRLLGDDAYLGNLNAPRQIVVAGSDTSLARVRQRALEQGARKAERLAMNVPSHCILLDKAAQELSRAASEITFNKPRIPYIGNRGARVLREADAIREDLATNLRYPVRWHESTIALSELGMRVLVEMPPGRTLTLLASEALPEMATVALESMPITSAASRIRARLAAL
ncbi:malonate decarboxylase subunit epsilon [Pararobbsia alpina]|uniref:Malonyl CoA-acyl carrier protein transacylase n=1 Tax=Pararobbsia alpina TaxID=621374 RepID=A0A6S7B6I6_9BURK|nr:malonate decarboxylase subunit epsilon [Pararobbsia alpina]CAB3789462.1 Malonyl CoA-acyl carrier protein transacylase [Pararobbsia alpina]